MKRKIIRLMAYIYMPLIFTLLGYSLIYIALSPALEMLQAVGSMVIAKETPDFSTGLKSIYQSANAHNVTPTIDDFSIAEGQAVAESVTGLVAETIAETVRETVSIELVEFPDYETEYASINCERIELTAPVYWGDTMSVLKAGVGNYMGSFMPGFGKPILLSGHNNTFLKPLQQIEIGDVINYDTNYGKYEYKVSEISIFYLTDATAMTKQLLASEEEKLIIYTCYPFETLVGTKMDRLFVFADKISGPTIE